MTYRQILLSLAVGQKYEFDSKDHAASAMTRACKLYGVGRKFSRCGAVVVRLS